MIKLIKELFALLTPSQRRRFYQLQFFVILMAFAEIAGIASIAPFMTLVGDISVLNGNGFFAQIYQWSGIEDQKEFVFWTGVFVLITLGVASIISMFTIWRLSLFSVTFGTELSDRLYSHYLTKDWLFHSSHNSAQLTKNISTETVRVTGQIIKPLLDLNAKVVLALFIAVSLFVFDPYVALTGVLIFAFSYLFLYKVVRKEVRKNGQNITVVQGQRFQLMNEGFGGVKDILLLNRQADFSNRFNQTGKVYARSVGNNTAIQTVPRYFMEFIAFGSMVGLVLYLLTKHGGNLGEVLPVLSLYALAGFKLLPAFQNIYSHITMIKGATSAFYSVRDDLVASQKVALAQDIDPSKHAQIEHSIELKDVTFTYPGKEQPVLKNFNLAIKSRSVVGIVGPSGSGKSTAIDLILGLIQPDQGVLEVDGIEINDGNRRTWQNTIGFVPQSIFLSEGSIAENVAFGIPFDEINPIKVKKALKLAHLDELIANLPDGMGTKVGERGVQLSGGQRQRIGIARALYHEAEVLVFDEATSALDGITEKMIMNAIHDFAGEKTIIMIAHRLKTVQKCDTIFMIDQGKVVDQGNFNELVEKNEHFKNMANHA